ncbi:hypothetical protein BGZ83_005844 [Gryganskiella cystojenkinii]|nr:hypothetical protein BGZ83_005844 [Gryganskiella cystojenkinii]
MITTKIIAEVNNTWTRLKRDLIVMQSAKLDMVNPASKLDAVTLDYDLDIEQNLAKPMRLFHELELEVSRSSRTREQAIEFGWADYLDLGDSDPDSPFGYTDLIAMAATEKRRRTITLEERPAAPGSDPASKFHFNLPDDVLVTEDNGLYVDAEGNLMDYMPTEGFPDADEGAANGGGSSPQADITNLGKRKQPHDQEPLNQVQTVPATNMSSGFDDFGLDQQEPQPNESDAEVPQKRARADVASPRKPRVLGLIIDDQTMLSREDLLEDKEHFMRDQALLIQDRAAKRAALDVKTHIEMMLSQPSVLTDCAPELKEFWSSATSRGVGRHPRPESEIRDQASIVQQGATRAEPKNFLAVDFEFDAGTGIGGDDYPELEIRRRHPSTGSGGTPVDLVGAGGGLATGSGEIGGHFGGTMPWSEYFGLGANTGAQSDPSVTDSDHHLQEFGSAFDFTHEATDPERQRTVWETENETTRGRDEARTRGQRRHRRPGMSRSRSESGSRDPVHPTWPRRIGGGNRVGSHTGSSISDHDRTTAATGATDDEETAVTTVTQERMALERETGQFLDYVRLILKDAGGGANSFSFSDVISIHKRRDVAASAFYHILSLSTIGVMRPQQKAPYDDIVVELHH